MKDFEIPKNEVVKYPNTQADVMWDFQLIFRQVDITLASTHQCVNRVFFGN